MKKILITGGTGFLGKALAKRFKNKYHVVISGRNNTQNLWAQRETGCEFMPMDVTNVASIKDCLNTFKPDIIIHAAATKFVDFSEKFPNEAIDINITGSQNIARLAIDSNVETVIGISTDKAAPPLHNMYSMTKAVMERLFCSLANKSNTNFMCTRFGNIAWSSGSVFPIWKDMLEKDGIIESTGPHMKRYFFTVEEAVDLVETGLHNIAILNGSILTLNMKAGLIKDILDVWTKNYGGKWKQVGERPGDSLGESLIGDIELPFSEKIIFNDIEHFKVNFAKKSSNPPTQSLNTETSEKLTAEEILTIIKSENTLNEKN